MIVNAVGRPLSAVAFSDSAIGFCFMPSSTRACVRLELLEIRGYTVAAPIGVTSTRRPNTRWNGRVSPRNSSSHIQTENQRCELLRHWTAAGMVAAALVTGCSGESSPTAENAAIPAAAVTSPPTASQSLTEAAPTIATSPTKLFLYYPAVCIPARPSRLRYPYGYVTISNTGGGTLNWTSNKSATWIKRSPNQWDRAVYHEGLGGRHWACPRRLLWLDKGVGHGRNEQPTEGGNNHAQAQRSLFRALMALPGSGGTESGVLEGDSLVHPQRYIRNCLCFSGAMEPSKVKDAIEHVIGSGWVVGHGDAPAVPSARPIS